MTPDEMKQEFLALYNLMAGQQNVAFMHIFGQVHKEMMDWFITNKPELAQEWLDKLESIRWNNYLTKAEAEKIFSNMDPKAPWPRDQWKQAMTEYGLDMEREPCYNRNALWVEMNKMYSDFGDEIAGLLGKPLAPTDKDIISACYKMAIKTLRDKDGIYNIRTYFGL